MFRRLLRAHRNNNDDKSEAYRADRVTEREVTMLNRMAMCTVVAGLLAVGGMPYARAQQPISSGQQAVIASGWTFNLMPYLWMPSVHLNVNYALPPALGGTVSANPSIGFGELVSHFNIGFAGSAEARYDRFSVLTDIMWLNIGGVAGQFKSVNFPDHPAIPISGARNTSESLKANAELWTLAGGYTLAQGDWGNFDAIAGFRLVAVSTTTNYSLGITIVGPRGNGATFGGVGGLSVSADIWNGIAGFRGRVRIPESKFFIPFYFDIGAGGSNLTWQIASGIGYRTPWLDVSLTYRYLSFDQGNNSKVEGLRVQGPMLAANFRF
jgi:hypothetical protein